MLEIYLISLLDGIRIAAVIAMILSVLMLLVYFASMDVDDESILGKHIKKAIVVLVASLLVIVIVPSKSTAYEIIGIGTTMEYLKDNEKVKELPDKCIDALGKWLENTSEEEDKE